MRQCLGPAIGDLLTVLVYLPCGHNGALDCNAAGKYSYVWDGEVT